MNILSYFSLDERTVVVLAVLFGAALTMGILTFKLKSDLDHQSHKRKG